MEEAGEGKEKLREELDMVTKTKDLDYLYAKLKGAGNGGADTGDLLVRAIEEEEEDGNNE